GGPANVRDEIKLSRRLSFAFLIWQTLFEAGIALTSQGVELPGPSKRRLAKRQIFDIDTWRIALDLFKARVVDPRVQRARWLADALVECAPPSGYEPVPAGVLDADTVWDALLRYRVGLPDGRPDAIALLRWSETAAEASRYTGLPTEF